MGEITYSPGQLLAGGSTMLLQCPRQLHVIHGRGLLVQ